jgi:hypothetical protein
LYGQKLVRVEGRVYDAESKAAMPGVRLAAVWVDGNTKSPASAVTRSQDDGRYAIDVMSGARAICVDAGKAFLDPCKWFPGTTVVDTSRTLNFDVALHRGVMLRVRVYDPDGYADAARTANPVLAKIPVPVFVLTSDDVGAVRPLPFISSSGNVSEFALLVPPKRTFAVTAGSSRLRLADDSGKALANNELRTTITMPEASESAGAPPPFGAARAKLKIPSQVLDLRITGLVSP